MSACLMTEGLESGDELEFGLGWDRWVRGRSRVLCGDGDGDGDADGDGDLLDGMRDPAREVAVI